MTLPTTLVARHPAHAVWALPLVLYALIPRGPEADVLVASSWALVLLASWLGWGRVLHHLCAQGLDGDAGLQLAWGVAFTTCVGGLLALIGIAHAPVLEAIVVLGLVMLAVVRRPAVDGEPVTLAGAALRIVPALVALYFAHFLVNAAYRSWMLVADDQGAYLAFPMKLLQRGTLIDPFSFRRMSTYGAHALMQALLSLRVNPGKPHLLDIGVGAVLAGAVVLWPAFRSRPRAVLLYVLAAALVITTPATRINISALMTGAAAMLAMARTMSIAAGHPRAFILVGMCAAHAASLKHTFLPVVALALLLWAGMLAVDGKRAGVMQRWRPAVLLLAASLTWVLPWMLLAISSNGTPFLVVWHGNFTPESLMLARHRTWAEQWDALREVATVKQWAPPLIALWPVVALTLSRREGRWLAAMIAASVVGYFATVFGHQNLSSAAFTVQYVAPFVTCGMGLGVFGLARFVDEEWPFPSVATIAGCVVAIVLGVMRVGDVFTVEVTERVRATRKWLDEGRRGPTLAIPPKYAAIQAHMPEGARVLAMVDEYAYFDHARNDIWSIDFPGWASPPPGLPVDGDPARLKAYLHAQGIEHIVFVKKGAAGRLSHYRAGLVDEMLAQKNPAGPTLARAMMNTWRALEGLVSTETVLADIDGFVLLRLERTPR